MISLKFGINICGIFAVCKLVYNICILVCNRMTVVFERIHAVRYVTNGDKDEIDAGVI